MYPAKPLAVILLSSTGIVAFSDNVHPLKLGTKENDDVGMIVLPKKSEAASDELWAVAAEFVKKYERSVSMYILSEHDIEDWVDQEAPALAQSIRDLKWARFAQAHGAHFIGSVSAGRYEHIHDCDAPPEKRESRRVWMKHSKLWGLSLTACTYGSDSELMHPDSGMRHIPNGRPFYQHGYIANRMIQRMFGVRVKGRRITKMYEYSVGKRDGLLVGDLIVEVNGTMVTDRNFLRTLSRSSPEAIHLKLLRESKEVDTIVRPIGLSEEHLFRLRCLGENIVELSSDPDGAERRRKWLDNLGQERQLIILSCCKSNPRGWMVAVDLVAERFKDLGVRWLAVSSESDMAKWTAATENNPVCAMHVRDSKLAEELNAINTHTHYILDSNGTILLSHLSYRDIPEIVKGLLDSNGVPARGL